MSNFFRDNWKTFIAILVVLSLLIVAYVFFLARPTEEYRDGNGGGTINAPHELFLYS